MEAVAVERKKEKPTKDLWNTDQGGMEKAKHDFSGHL
ncbi:hypothetical protein DES34_102346 [Brevibacillus brevis]|nr:hypothetical protein DES34_102346 [Brevibacillus brevis]VEF92253.1 Uncharacterised protein [Brevibacillus brevis]